MCQSFIHFRRNAMTFLISLGLFLLVTELAQATSIQKNTFDCAVSAEISKETNCLKPLPIVINTEPIKIALGVDEYLEEFSEKIGALPYWKWEQVVGKPVTAGMEWEAFRSVLLEIAQMPNITLHFNLSTPSKALVSELKDKNSYTSREFMLIKLAFWDKTTLYTKSGTIYKIYDKKKIK